MFCRTGGDRGTCSGGAVLHSGGDGGVGADVEESQWRGSFGRASADHPGRFAGPAKRGGGGRAKWGYDRPPWDCGAGALPSRVCRGCVMPLGRASRRSMGPTCVTASWRSLSGRLRRAWRTGMGVRCRECWRFRTTPFGVCCVGRASNCSGIAPGVSARTPSSPPKRRRSSDCT